MVNVRRFEEGMLLDKHSAQDNHASKFHVRCSLHSVLFFSTAALIVSAITSCFCFYSRDLEKDASKTTRRHLRRQICLELSQNKPYENH